MQKWEYCYALNYMDNVEIIYFRPDTNHKVQVFLEKKMVKPGLHGSGVYAAYAWLGIQGWEMIEIGYFKRPLQDQNT